MLLTRGLVYLGIVGAVCRTGAKRAWWLGFLSFGWTYLHAHHYYGSDAELPTTTVLTMLGPVIGVPTMEEELAAGETARVEAFYSIGDSLWTVVAALTGGFLAQTLYAAAAAARTEGTGDGTQPARPMARNALLAPCVAMLVGLASIAAITVGGARLTHGIWAGATYLLTWWLLGLAALGALVGRGRRRQFWFGAAFFGMGFLFLSFSQPPFADRESRLHVPTVAFLEAIRPRFQTLVAVLSGEARSAAPQNARIRWALAQRPTMRFSKETTLADVIQFLKQAMRGPDGNAVPIYVDPIGLQEAEKTVNSTMTGMNLEGVPLRTSLEYCLKQFDLAYVVEDELLLISSRESLEFYHYRMSPSKGPFLIVGHCLLALISAGLGGVAAPLDCKLVGVRCG